MVRKLHSKPKPDYQKYCEEHGRNFNQRSEGVDMDIVLEVKVPRNIEVKLESVYGIVEVKNYTGPLSVEATYGGVDVSGTGKKYG